MSLLFQEQLNQPINLSGSFTGSFSGSINGSITSASYATTASYLEGYVSTSIYNIFTSSYYTDSASFDYRIDNIVVNTGSYSVPPIITNVATTAVLPRTPLYNNGSSGIGAFLSASISGTLGNIDGVTLTSGDSLLVKNQSNQTQNGVYSVITTGSASSYYILSRSLSSDETSELDSQIVIPSFGTTNRGGIFAQTTNNPIIGTDSIVYSLQTNTLISQTSAGTQAIYQIPWYIASTRQLSKGSPNFKYTNVTSGTTVTTSSLVLTGSFSISGSLQVTNGITGSLLGTASYWSGSINNVNSASYALTASYAASSPGGGASLSGLTLATATNTIDNLAYQQNWSWNSLTSGTGLKLSSNSTAASGSLQTILEVAHSGTNATGLLKTFAARITSDKGSNSNANTALYLSATGVTFAGASNSRALEINSGDIYINSSGTVNPYIRWSSGASLFDNTVGLMTFSTPYTINTGINFNTNAVYGVQGLNHFSGTSGWGLSNLATSRNALMLGAAGYFGGYASGQTSAVVLERDADVFSISADNAIAGGFFTPTKIVSVRGSTANMGIGTQTPVASALLDLTSTARGFLKPRMTTVNRDAIASPATGLEVYNTTLNTPNTYDGTRWTSGAKFLTATASLDFPSTAAGAVSDLTITVTGAADGDVVMLGVPNASIVAAGSFSAWVSAADTVTVRYANNSLLTAYDPTSGTFKVTVNK